MTNERRLNRLEQAVPGTREPLVVTVRHRILEPGPSGPIQTGDMVRRYVDGVMVEKRTNHLHPEAP